MFTKLRDVMIHGAKWVDFRWRSFDFWFNRTDPGGWWQRYLPLAPRQSPAVLLLGAVVLLAVTNGPLLFDWRGPSILVLVVVSLMLQWLVLRQAARHADPLLSNCMGGWRGWLPLMPWIACGVWGVLVLLLHPPGDPWVGAALLIGCVALGLFGAAATPRGTPPLYGWIIYAAAAATTWFLASPDAVEAQAGVPYRHTMAPLGVLLLFMGLPFSRWWAWFLFQDHRERYREAFRDTLNKTQLFDPRIHSKARGTDIIRSYFLAIVNTPLQLLFFPSLVVVLAPFHWVIAAGVIAFVISWMFMAMVVFHPRLNAVLDVINRLFMEGGALLLTLLVIVFAGARLAGVTYVTTILDGAARATLVAYVVAFYAVFWLNDYWSSRALCDAMLGFLDNEDAAPSRVPYHPPGDPGDHACYVQPHGGTRLLVLRDRGPDQKPHFNVWRPLDLFRRIAQSSRIQSAARRRLPLLESQARFYRTFPGVLVVGVLLWASSCLKSIPEDPHIVARVGEGAPPATCVLDDVVEAIPGNHVYLVAASGGGTRAALYAQVLLRGLADRNVGEGQTALHRVALVSSVSGGSLSNAFFAHRRKDLLRDDPAGKDAWADFRAAVTASHIEEVLDGAFEWRLVVRTGLGSILKESFGRWIDGPRSWVGNCSDVGLIFNTSLNAQAKTGVTPMDRTSGRDSGSRVVLTNLRGFTGPSTRHAAAGYAADLRYVCLADPDIPLTSAASASANFPPVFSNVALDAQGRGARAGDLATHGPRYWVTDGGAVENRGLMSLLLALRTWLGSKPPAAADRTFHIIVADASAYSPDASKDRGLGAVFGAALPLGSKLLAPSLLSEVQDLHPRGAEGVKIHDFTLPDVFRIGGSFGTHWMMPGAIELSDPTRWDDPDRKRVILDEREVLQAFDQLFRKRRQWPAPQLADWLGEQDPEVRLNELLKQSR